MAEQTPSNRQQKSDPFADLKTAFEPVKAGGFSIFWRLKVCLKMRVFQVMGVS
jgi:hypothetical protein